MKTYEDVLGKLLRTRDDILHFMSQSSLGNPHVKPIKTIEYFIANIIQQDENIHKDSELYKVLEYIRSNDDIYLYNVMDLILSNYKSLIEGNYSISIYGSGIMNDTGVYKGDMKYRTNIITVILTMMISAYPFEHTNYDQTKDMIDNFIVYKSISEFILEESFQRNVTTLALCIMCRMYYKYENLNILFKLKKLIQYTTIDFINNFEIDIISNFIKSTNHDDLKAIWFMKMNE